MSNQTTEPPVDLDTSAALNVANLVTYYRLGGEFPQVSCVVCREPCKA